MTVGVRFAVDVGDVQAVTAKYEQAFSAPSLMAWLKGDALDYFQDASAKRFANERSETRVWAQLRDATNEIRATQGFPREHPINVRTGKLKEHMLETGDVRAAGNSGAWLTYPSKPKGKTKSKLRVAQEGTDKNPKPGFGRTERRPVLHSDPMNEVQLLVRSLGVHVARGISGGSNPFSGFVT